MPLMFNTILQSEDLRLKDIRLLRHQDTSSQTKHSPYQLWRDDRRQFDLYQSLQSIKNRAKLNSPYWASFVVTPAGETMFVGLYRAEYRGLLEQDTQRPHQDGVDLAGTCDAYDLALDDALQDLIGRLFIDWGSGFHAWIQRADQQNKPVLEIRRQFAEPSFPGFLNFMEPLWKLESLPGSWVTALQAARGVYLLTCPRTKEQYVGAAYGEGGFWPRWLCYAKTGHGENIALKSRDPSDYQVSILEVAGSACGVAEILAMEQRWKAKLQSKEMGLNRN